MKRLVVIACLATAACGGSKSAQVPALAARAAAPARNDGLALEKRGDLDGALQSYRSAYEAQPENPATGRDLARILARRGDLRSARSVLDASLKRTPDDVELLTFKAVLARLEGDTEGSYLSAKAALVRSPGHSGATLELARALTKQRKTTLAEAMLMRAAEAAPNDARLSFGLAEIARAMGDDARALAELQTAAAKDPKDASVQAAIGSLALAHRDYARARQAYERAIALGDDSQASSQGLQVAMAQTSKEKAQ